MIKEKQFNKKMLLDEGSLIVANDIARTFNSVGVAVNFNNWHNQNKPLNKFETENYSFSVIHRKSREYQFKYLIDSSRWLNRVGADKKVLNKFQSVNSVVVL